MRIPFLKSVLTFACIAAAVVGIANANAPSSATASTSNQSYVSRSITNVRDMFTSLVTKNTATADAANNSLRSTLQTIRSQIEVYKLQHNDRYPSLNNMQDWSALLETTDDFGHIKPNGNRGPYLSSPPINPFNNNSNVVAAGHPTKDAGWSYDENTGKVRAIATHATLNSAGSLEADVEFAPEN